MGEIHFHLLTTSSLSRVSLRREKVNSLTHRKWWKKTFLFFAFKLSKKELLLSFLQAGKRKWSLLEDGLVNSTINLFFISLRKHIYLFSFVQTDPISTLDNIEIK